jgi:hypothetical protein
VIHYLLLENTIQYDEETILEIVKKSTYQIIYLTSKIIEMNNEEAENKIVGGEGLYLINLVNQHYS